MRFDYVRMMLPIEIVEMFQQLLLRNNRSRPMNKVFKNPIFRRREIEKLTATANSLLNSIHFHIRHR